MTSGGVHWLVRIAERAGHDETKRPEIAAGTGAQEAWSDITRSYGLSDDELARLVAD